MKRWTLRIVCLLLLGIITTVAVAWGLACRRAFPVPSGLSGHVTYAIDLQMQPIQPVWEIRRNRKITGRHEMTLNGLDESLGGWVPEHDDTLPEWSIGFASPPSAADLGAVGYSEVACGWPRLSNLARVRSSWTTGQGSPVRDREAVAGIAAPEWASSLFVEGAAHYLPLRPILPGFIINTLFYAAVWFCLLFGFTRLKRTIRKKRGRCPMCGYVLRHPGTEATRHQGAEAGTEEQMNGGTEDAARLRSSAPPSRRSEPGCPECGWGRAAP